MNKGVFDAGRFAGHDLATGRSHRIEAVLEDLDRLGAAGALVGSYRALYQDVVEGNREAAAWAAAHPGRLWALAIVHPAYFGSPPRSLVRWLRTDLGCSALGMFGSPGYYPIEWAAPAIRAIGEAAAELDMPLQAGITNERELADVVRAWGDLPVPVMVRWMGGHRYRLLAHETAAAAKNSHVLFDVGNMCSTGMIAHAAEMIGASRLFFASNAPHNIADAAHVMLDVAGLDHETAAAISERTARRALKIADGSIAQAPRGSRGPLDRLLTAPKIDVHWHVDHWNLGENAVDPSIQLETFARFNYTAVVGSSILALNNDLAAGNASVERWVSEERRRFGLIAIDPLRSQESLEQIARYRDHPRFVGVKTIQDPLGLGLDDASYSPLLVAAQRANLPILCHFPGVEKAAATHPDASFVVAHATWRRARACIEAENVAFDIATSHANADETRLEPLLETVGVRRILFGSDGQLISPAWSLAKLAAVALDDDALAMIMRENARRIFSRIT